MEFSKTWNSSKKPKKQKLYRYNAPLHIKQGLVSVHLSKELRKEHGKRAMQLRKGDKIKILRGQYKGKTGLVEDVDLKREKITIEGIYVTKKDGTKTFYRIHPSNIMIIEMKLEDKMRQKIIERKKKGK